VNPRGAAAETLACDYLRSQGLVVAARNYRCRFGEIDIVAREGAMLVFIEVRQRRSEAFGGAAASITRSKRRRILTAARYYLARLRPAPPCRFDALLIRGEPARIEWIKNAFGE
jgi:putative endonuclease